MSINPICNKCGNELKEFGGLIFSPLDKKDIVKKYHICRKCFKKIEKSINK